MFLRFSILEADPDSRQMRGLFIAAHELFDAGMLETYEAHWLQGLLDWFNQNLESPKCLARDENDRAICWFRADAGEHVRKMWELVSFFRSRGIHVRVHKSAEPGTIVYSDGHQVAAIPRRRKR
jgi:hypothetical protein